MSQFQGYVDINMGRGAIVIGLAAVIIGEVIGLALLGKHLNFWEAYVCCSRQVVLHCNFNSSLAEARLKRLETVYSRNSCTVPCSTYLKGQKKSSFKLAKRGEKVRC